MKNKTKQKPAAPLTKQPAGSAAAELEIIQGYARVGNLARQERIKEAAEVLNVLYGKYPEDGRVNFALAALLDQNGQRADALPFAEKAVKLSPGNGGWLVLLGKIYNDLALQEKALPALMKAATIPGSAYQSNRALGEFYVSIGQGEKALAHFLKALEVAPAEGVVPVKRSLAEIYALSDKVDQAVKLYEELAEIKETAKQSKSQIVHLTNSTADSPRARALEVEIGKNNNSPTERSRMLLSLGRAYEVSKDYDKAFEVFSEAKKGLNHEDRVEELKKAIDDVVTNYTPENEEAFRSYGNPTDRPFFVIGMPRSGTTMTEQILASHSRIEGVGELVRMGQLSTRLCFKPGVRKMFERMKEVGPANWFRLSEQYLNLLDVLAPGAQHTVDKMPHNFVHVGFIHMCFPNAKFIHCARNPLDTFISAYQNNMNERHNYSYDQEAYGHYYIQYLRLVDYWKSVVPGRIFELRYEETTANPETKVRELLEFLGLPFEEQCLRFNERGATVRTFSSRQVRNAINTNSVARWRRYEKHLGPIRKILDEAGIPY